jgi:hypothetical protein
LVSWSSAIDEHDGHEDLRNETSLKRLEADLEREWKALEDAHAQILAHELDADRRETGLRDQEARLAARERQLAERQMQELAVAQKGLEDLQASRVGDGQRVWSFLGQADIALASFGFNPVRGGDAALEAGVVLPLLDSARRKISQLEEAIGSHLEEEGRAMGTSGGRPRAHVLPELRPQHLPRVDGARARQRVCGGHQGWH